MNKVSYFTEKDVQSPARAEKIPGHSKADQAIA